MDRRDFTGLNVRAKAAVLRMVATADYGNWDSEANFHKVIKEAINLRRAMGWFVFSSYSPDELRPQGNKKRCRPADELPRGPAKKLNFD